LVRSQTRSYTAPIVLGAAAGCILVAGPQRYFAVPVAFLALMMLAIPNRVLAEGYDSYIIIYDPHDKVCCTVVYISEIARWGVRGDGQGGRCICLILKDDETIIIPGVASARLLGYLAGRMPDRKGIPEDASQGHMKGLL